MSVLPSFRASVRPSFRPSGPSVRPSRFVSGAEHKNRERYLNQTWHKDRYIGELVPFDSLGFFWGIFFGIWDFFGGFFFFWIFYSLGFFGDLGFFWGIFFFGDFFIVWDFLGIFWGFGIVWDFLFFIFPE